MTQALLNNLNINTKDTSFMSDKKADATASDTFDKIFQSQKEIETQQNNETVNLDKNADIPTSQYTSNEPKLPDDNELAAELQEFIDGYNPYISEEEEEETEESDKKEVEAKDLTLTDLPAINNIAAYTIICDEFKSVSTESTEQTSVKFNSNLDSTEIEFDNKDPEAIIKNSKTDDTESKSQLEEMLEEKVLNDLNIESVEAESGDCDSDLMQKQTPEEQGVKAMIGSGSNLNNADFEVTSEIVSVKSTSDTTSGRIIDQIAKHLENLNNNSKVNIVLNPESLGKVSIQLINTKEGLSAQFTVATQEARNLLLKGLDGLKESLLSQGINVENVSVKLSETQESEYHSDWTEQENSNGGNKEQGKRQEKNNKQDFEQMMFSAQNDNENGNV